MDFSSPHRNVLPLRTMAARGVPPESSDQTPESDWPVEKDKCSGSGWGDEKAGEAWGSHWSEEKTEEQEEEMAGTEYGSVLPAETMSTSFAAQVNPEEFQREAKEFTRSEVQKLIASPEYQVKITRCLLCWSVWCEGEFSPSCAECGGFGMQRPCPICLGKCGSTWTRDIEMSHSHNQAHWNGDCVLPADQRQGLLAQHLMDYGGGEESLLDAMTDLHAS